MNDEQQQTAIANKPRKRKTDKKRQAQRQLLENQDQFQQRLADHDSILTALQDGHKELQNGQRELKEAVSNLTEKVNAITGESSASPGSNVIAFPEQVA
jgi:putative NADH-flavin reductase